jgi:hypothetical protein
MRAPIISGKRLQTSNALLLVLLSIVRLSKKEKNQSPLAGSKNEIMGKTGCNFEKPLNTSRREEILNEEGEEMSTLQLLQKKCDQLQERLNRNQQKKCILELKINQEFEELKKSEIFLEICSEKRKLGSEHEVPIEKPTPIGDAQHVTCGSSFERQC